MGVLERQSGEFESALQFFAKAQQLKPNTNQTLTILNNEAIVYSQLGDMAAAIGQQEKVVALLEPAGGQGSLDGRLTLIRFELRNGAQAPRLRGLLGPVRQTKIENAESRAYLLNTIGMVEERAGEPEKALTAFSSALQEQSLRVRTRADSHHGRGRVLARLGRRDEATAAFDLAYKLREDIGYRAAAADVLADQARMELQAGDLQGAEKLARQAVSAINELRASVTADQLRASYWATKQGYYDTWIESLMRLHEKNAGGGFDRKAFAASEERRARALLDLLAEDLVLDDVPAELLQRRRELRRRHGVAADRAARSSSTNTSAFEEFKRLEWEWGLLEAEIKDRSPAYAKLVRPAPPTLEQVQEALAQTPDTVLLEISSRYAFLVSGKTFNSYDLGEGLAAAARELAAIVPGPRAFAPKQLREFEELVFSKFRDKLVGKRLVLVLDGELQTIPWNALMDPKRRYLGAMHEMAREPSAGVWLELRSGPRKRRARTPVHAIGDAVYSSEDSDFPPRLKGQDLPDFPAGFRPDRLYFAPDELDAIKKLFPAGYTEARRLKATKEGLNSALARNAETLHFVMHARDVPGRPDQSGLAFSVASATRVEPSAMLRMFEIYNMKLSASLVVLSACETARGTNVPGEGLVGLSRAFFHAGARTVIASLWKVSDKSTSELMTIFYQQLKLGVSPAMALRAAQQKLATSINFSDPYHWAGFVLLGDWR